MLNLLVPIAIENSSVFYATGCSITADGFCLFRCRDVCSYLVDMPVTPRRVAAFTSMFDCPCGYTKKYNLTVTHGDYLLHSFQYFVAQCRGLVFTEDHYEKFGLVGVMGMLDTYEKKLEKNMRFIDDVISLDRVPLLPFSYEVIAKVIERVTYLKREFPSMWEDNLSKYYKSYFKAIYKVAGKSNIKHDLLESCTSIFPTKIDVRSQISKVPLYNLVRHSYKNVRISPGMVTSMSHAIIKDPQSYIDDMRQRNRDNLDTLISDSTKVYGDRVAVVNTKDTIGDNIEDYHPSDIVRYCDFDGKIYQFSAPEYPTIAKNGVNLYTQEPISPNVKFVVKSYLKISKDASKEVKPLAIIIHDIANPKSVEELLGRPGFYQKESVRMTSVNPVPTRRDPIFIISRRDTISVLLFNPQNPQSPITRLVPGATSIWIPGMPEPQCDTPDDHLDLAILTCETMVSNGIDPSDGGLANYVSSVFRRSYLSSL
jgi:hypothetical protein